VISEIESTESDPYSMFLFAMRSPKTREKCTGRLRMFFDFLSVLPEGTMTERSKAFCDKARSDNGWAFSSIIRYLQTLKERVETREITAGTMKNRYQAVKLFCEMADIAISWKKISRGIPRVRKFADDRAPTIEEIQKIMEYPDRRIKAIICTMCSSGIRVGACDFLKWKHIVPIERNGATVAAKIIVYAGEEDEYFTFITPEAYHELERWKEYRIHAGEQVTKESWIMRNTWNTKKGYTRGLVSAPVKLQAEGVKRLVEDALWTQGLRKRLEYNKKRHEFQTDHGFRKWFNTRCELAGMKPIHIQLLMAHSLGISDSYLRPTQDEILEEYLKAVDFLTIHDHHRLQKQVTDVSQKAKEENSLLRAKLEQRDNDIAELKAAVVFLSDKVNAAIIANEPSNKIISDQKGVPKEITFTSMVGNAKAEISK
jgi:integrase